MDAEAQISCGFCNSTNPNFHFNGCGADRNKGDVVLGAEASKIIGAKYDQGKMRWNLLPWDAVTEVMKVVEAGATKYTPDGYRHVDNWRDRYFSASMRHLMAWKTGEQNDSEWGYPHLAHACTCLLFILSMELAEKVMGSDGG